MENSNANASNCKPTIGIADVAPISKLIFSVTKQMRRVFDEQARLQDMTLPQWRALGQLAQSDGLSQSALAVLIEADQMTTSKILRLLEARGLIARLPDPADSRAKIVRVTPPVYDMVEAMRAAAADLHETMLQGIPEADKQVLVRTLNKISDNLAGQSDRQKDFSK